MAKAKKAAPKKSVTRVPVKKAAPKKAVAKKPSPKKVAARIPVKKVAPKKVAVAKKTSVQKTTTKETMAISKKEKQNLYAQLIAEKYELHQQIEELNSELDGKENKGIAKKVAQLELEKHNINKELDKLKNDIVALKAKLETIATKTANISKGSKKELIEAVKKQRWFFFKDPKDILFDSHTGILWPNLDYHTIYDGDYLYSLDEAEKIIAKIKYGNLSNWQLPSKDIATVLLSDKSFPHLSFIKKDEYLLLDSNRINLVSMFVNTSNKGGVFIPCNKKFATADFTPDGKSYTVEERIGKILDLFISQKWQPNFKDEKATILFTKLFKTRPQLIKRESEIEQKLNELGTLNQAMVNGFNFEQELANIDINKTERSLISYNNSVIEWINNILEKIDLFKINEEELLSVAEELNDKIDKLASYYNNKSTNKRNEFLSKNLDFNIESISSEMLKIKKEAIKLKKEIENTTNMQKLAEIENRNYPSFNLVAEQTATILNNRLEKIEWFRKNKEITEKIVELHEEWSEDFDILLTSNKDKFFQKGEEEVIDKDKLITWFSKWEEERTELDSRLLPLMQSGFDGTLDFQILNSIIVKVTEYREALKDFYLNKRIPIYIKFADKDNEQLLDNITCEKNIFEISDKFQQSIEELIFESEKTETRLLIAEWAQQWIDVRVAQIIALSKHDSMPEVIAKNIIAEVRAFRNKSFATLIKSKESYAMQREESYNKMQSLTRKMLRATEK